MSVADAIAVVALTVAAVWLTGSALYGGSGAAGRILAGVLAIVAVGWVGMLASTLGIAVLGERTGLRVATAVVLIALVALRRPNLRPPRPNAAAVVAAAVAAVVLWPSVSAPANLIRGADAAWHDGWTHQLMGGATAPGGPYSGIPDAYPWLYHALAAWLAQVSPGGLVGGFLAIQVLALLALGAGTWLLASELGLGHGAAGWATVFVLGGAGVGWIWQHEPAAVLALKNGLSAYHGDFILPNAMSTGLGNLAPLLPREIALALLPGVLWLAVRAAASASMRLALLAGAVAGFAALLGPVVGGLSLAAMVAIAIATRYLGLLVALAGAAATTSVWLIPLALSYHAHGGLQTTTTQIAPDPTLSQAAVALGMMLPLAAAGFVMLARRGMLRPELVAITAVPVAACAAGILVGSGHIVLGTPAIVHWLRYVPVLAVALVLPAGYAATTLVAGASRRALPLGAVLAATIAAAALVSTGLASAAIRDQPTDPGLACARPFPLGPSDTVAVSSGQTWISAEIGFWLFARSGTRLLWLPPRLARVPFRRLPAGVPPEATRRRELLSIAHGGDPPAAVRWVVTNRPAAALASDLQPYARCVWRQTIPLSLYRVEPPS